METLWEDPTEWNSNLASIYGKGGRYYYDPQLGPRTATPRAKVQHLGCGDILSLTLAVLEVSQVGGHVVANVHGNDGGGLLAGT